MRVTIRRNATLVIRLKLKGKLGINIEILALGFLVIYSPLQTPIAINQYPHLQDLELADDSPVDHNLDTIDILIRSNDYWDVVTRGIVRRIHGPVAISINLRWLLSGPSESMEGGYTVSNLVVEGREAHNGSTQGDAILI